MEIWKDVKGYEGLYKVSNKGNVISLPKPYHPKESVCKKLIWNKGYLKVVLCKNGVQKGHFIHRLVAQAFIPNPDDLPQVNHKDEDKTNNCVENLEWCNNSYNQKYGTLSKRKSEKFKGENNPFFGKKHPDELIKRIADKNSKPIYNTDSDGNIIKHWKNMVIAASYYNVSKGAIWRCLNGKSKTCCGFNWYYEQTEQNNNENKNKGEE